MKITKVPFLNCSVMMMLLLGSYLTKKLMTELVRAKTCRLRVARQLARFWLAMGIGSAIHCDKKKKHLSPLSPLVLQFYSIRVAPDPQGWCICLMRQGFPRCAGLPPTWPCNDCRLCALTMWLGKRHCLCRGACGLIEFHNPLQFVMACCNHWLWNARRELTVYSIPRNYYYQVALTKLIWKFIQNMESALNFTEPRNTSHTVGRTKPAWESTIALVKQS